MPNITLIKKHFISLLNKFPEISSSSSLEKKLFNEEEFDKEFDELCFKFGVEIDEIETQIIEVNFIFYLFF